MKHFFLNFADFNHFFYFLSLIKIMIGKKLRLKFKYETFRKLEKKNYVNSRDIKKTKCFVLHYIFGKTFSFSCNTGRIALREWFSLLTTYILK